MDTLSRALGTQVDGILGFGTFEDPIVEVIKSGTRLAGWEVLRRFAWTFDHDNRRISMIANSNEPIRMESVIGIVLNLPGVLAVKQ